MLEQAKIKLKAGLLLMFGLKACLESKHSENSRVLGSKNSECVNPTLDKREHAECFSCLRRQVIRIPVERLYNN